MSITDSIVKVSIGDKLKQTRPGYHLHELEFPAYSPDQRLCPVSVVKQYLTRTNLFGATLQTYLSVLRDPIGQLVKVQFHIGLTPLSVSQGLTRLVLNRTALGQHLALLHLRQMFPWQPFFTQQAGPVNVPLCSIIRKRCKNRALMLLLF